MRALLSPSTPAEGPPVPDPLVRGARARRAVWLDATRLRVWDFDRSAAYAGAIRALVGVGASPMDGYQAAGVLLDLVEGRPPTMRLPIDWRTLPDGVRTVLGLPSALASWTRDGLRAGPEVAQVREAMRLAAVCEANGDEAWRAMFAAAGLRRRVA